MRSCCEVEKGAPARALDKVITIDQMLAVYGVSDTVIHRVFFVKANAVFWVWWKLFDLRKLAWFVGWK